ncbi:hypothetical protein [Paenarthrobacter sp. YJN-5]|uniref:hypothetical protein n=1 Tax=Paenarthrobacter sp. YJN-5 TaxID=2735316 RepID=UPI001877DB42|nr:hypothetical protein [Paenarthrobacter sp. YJN-5]QOT15883.1 hypothetical protein HMI59_04285 [Paenarthrobacter sp. YJN-5]
MSDTPVTPAATPEPVTPAAAAPAPEGVEVDLKPGEHVITAKDAKTYDEAFVESLRTEKQQAEAAADAKIKAALKALGISDEVEDPLKAAQDAAATNAAERDTARAAARDTSAELIVWRSAAELGVDPAAVTDSRAFERAIKDLDPADPKFGEAVKEAATNAAKNNPKLKAAAPAPGAGGADFAGGTGETVGIDARIAAAEKAGDHALAIKLKRQKAYTN